MIRPPRSDLPAASVGIASQKPFLDRISGPVSCAPMMTGAFAQTSAAAAFLQRDQSIEQGLHFRGTQRGLL